MVGRIITLAEEMARDLGGAASVVADGDWPSMAIAFSKRHLVLLRDHHRSLTVSLPIEGSWHLQNVTDWSKVSRAVAAAVTHHRAAHPNAVSLADAVVSLRPFLTGFDVHFPGVPVPTECWLKAGEQSVGLFQRSEAIQVVVWVGDAMRSQACPSLESLAALPSWLDQALREQANALAAAAAEKARRAALPIPTLREVLAALARGERFSVGGGRWSETYFIEGGRLRREIFDEGHVEIRDGKERELQALIEQYPDSFRKS